MLHIAGSPVVAEQVVKNYFKEQTLGAMENTKLINYVTLKGYKQELKATVKENEALRHSVEKWREDASVTR